MSKETADLLRTAGKEHWIKVRHDVIKAKGKGEMQTFWLDANRDENETPLPTKGQGSKHSPNTTNGKTKRLIDWQVDVLSRFLKQIVARRKDKWSSTSSVTQKALQWKPKPGKICLDEVQEIIWLPEFDAEATRNQEDPYTIELSANVTRQLREFITAVANLYRANHFHGFEHACHVTMSVTKLLSRIVMPSDLDYIQTKDTDVPSDERTPNYTIDSTLHDHTYGITSDPLTQFSLVFAALIHDVDHTGVPNTVLIEENTTLATVYRGKSVAEQNSIDLSWTLLQSEKFNDLRACIYCTADEFARFRQLVVQVSRANVTGNLLLGQCTSLALLCFLSN